MNLPGLGGGAAAAALWLSLAWWLMRRDEREAPAPVTAAPAIPPAPQVTGLPPWWYGQPALDYGRDSTGWNLLVAEVFGAAGVAA